MKTQFSRRKLLQGAGAVAGGVAASKMTGGLISPAFAQTAPEKSALLVVFLEGGYNSVFGSADSYAPAGTFGVTGTNQSNLGNGLVVDGPTFGTLSPYALQHMATVGVRHGITAHGTAQNANFSDGSRSYALRLAAAIGGDAAIKAVQVGQRGVPGAKPAEGAVSLQVITDMSSTIAALGGAVDPTIPDRAIAANGLLAARNMSARAVAGSPRMLTSMTEGYAAGIETLQKPVRPFNFADLTTAYGVAATTRTVNNFTNQILAAELMIQAGANVAVAMDGGWDTHGDTSANNVRNMMNTRILPPLKVFMNRMMNRPDMNVGILIFGDFARSLPGSDHASSLSATVIGKYVKVGTTGKMSANVQLPAGTPSVPGLWSLLSEAMRVPTASNPFGANQHPSLLL
jgi:Protein of unknown function (DUF1501)